jgi:hypothetical protein
MVSKHGYFRKQKFPTLKVKTFILFRIFKKIYQNLPEDDDLPILERQCNWTVNVFNYSFQNFNCVLARTFIGVQLSCPFAKHSMLRFWPFLSVKDNLKMLRNGQKCWWNVHASSQECWTIGNVHDQRCEAIAKWR